MAFIQKWSNTVSKKYSELDEKILIVDDEDFICDHINETVQELGLKSVIAKDGEAALAIVQKKEALFLIISDYLMPKMDGNNLCQEVRKLRPELPFLISSGCVNKSIALDSIHAGVTDVIEKPYRADTLKAIIQKYADARVNAIEQERKETEEISELFAEEASSLFEGLENQILRLEESPLDRSVVDVLFRNVHSVKGGAAAIPGCQSIAMVGHAFESCLSLIKNGNFLPKVQDMEVFLATSDLCQRLIRLVHDKQKEGPEIHEQVQQCILNLEAIKAKETGQILKDSHIGIEYNSGLESANPMTNSSEGNSTNPNFSGLPSGNTQPTSNSENEGVWVSNEKLDAFMKLSGEMIVLKNYFQVLGQETELRQLSSRISTKLTDFSYSLNKITDNLQDKIMSVRKVTLERALSKLPRIFRQVTKELNKKVILETEGFELGVDRTIANVLSTCMTHMLRNAIDHGIENLEIRKEQGKPNEGKIKIVAKEQKGMIFVTISDDGGGIDRNRVIKKAVEKNLIEEYKQTSLTDEEAFDLLFLPGFSTAEKVTEISGRGVGMDVVKSEILNIKGKVRIESVLGQGTRFNIEIPVPKTVIVEQTVLVKSGETLLAVPLSAIAQLTSTKTLITTHVGQEKTCQFQGRTVSLKRFGALVQSVGGACSGDLNFEDTALVILQHKNEYLGLLVDSIHDQLEAVIRPFDKITNTLPGFKGTTVLGDDSIAYVVAPDEFVNLGLGIQRNLAA
jgi:two-component system chemotaxis sensor kinase CheA